MKSKYFPDYDRFQRPSKLKEVFGEAVGSNAHLCNQRSKGKGFPYLKQGGKVIYDIDACYEYALAEGSGKAA
jgi:hypothetical protein